MSKLKYRFFPLILFMLLWTVFASGQAETFYSDMRVINCREYVSLRAEPDASSRRLLKVPLGATVTDCTEETDGFIRCTYRGKTGYILSEYLTPADPFDRMSRPKYSQFITLGTTSEDFFAPGGHVAIQKYTLVGEEVLRVGLFDQSGQFRGGMAVSNTEIGQVSSLNAFYGGDANPVLLLYDGEYLSAYGISPAMGDDQIWSVELGTACTAHAVDGEGNIFLAGWFSGKVFRISRDGKLLWTAHPGSSNIYWPYRIGISGNRIEVCYEESGRHDGTTAIITYRISDGKATGIRYTDGD